MKKRIPKPTKKEAGDITFVPMPNTYTLDQLKEVWYLGMINGAMILKVCQDNTTDEVSSFSKVTDELRRTVTGEQSLKDVASNNMLLLGTIAEILGIAELK